MHSGWDHETLPIRSRVRRGPRNHPRAGFTLARLGSQAGGLSGLVYLERGTYLHLGVNIAYSAGGPTYRIDESRRIKFYDKQYYDHPAIGVLAMVTPSQGAKPPGR